MRSRVVLRVSIVLVAGCVAVLCCPAGWSQSLGADSGPGSAAQPGSAQAAASQGMTAEERRHATPEWQTISGHLPDPATATPQKLEMAADVLRARKFPDEGLAYYRSALARGGDPAVLLNKIGVTELELQMLPLAALDFKRAVKLNKKNADAWNNLAAAEYLQRNFGSSVGDFKKAVSLEKKSAMFHANLGNAYFQDKNFTRARREFETAVKLDPHVFDYHGAGGIRTQLQSPEDRGRFCFELARLYAGQGDEASTLHWLAMSAESGYDVMDAMRGDAVMVKYRKDPRVVLLAQNAKQMHNARATDRSQDRPAALTVEQPLQ